MIRGSACIGRVGGLALALGIGAAVAVGYAGSASADPAGDTSTAAAASDAAPRSRPPAKPKAAASRAGNGNTAAPVVAARVAAPAPSTQPVAKVRLQVPVESISAGPITAAAQPLSDLSGNREPALSPVGWVVYAAVRRQTAARVTSAAKTASAGSSNPILSFFFNQTPTAKPSRDVQGASGVITGELNAVDDDSDVLTYTVDVQPIKGTVAIDAAGHYTYTPNPTLAATGGADTFTVTVSDADSGFHIHGIMGLINLLTFGLLGSNGHSTTDTINLSVLAATVTTGIPSSSTGVLTGTVTASGVTDQFSYTGRTSSKGGTVDANADGTFIYTPTPEARHAASSLTATAADKSDTFTINIKDGLGGEMNVPITTAITPANNAPTATPNVYQPNVTTGVVAGAVLGMDADDDPLTYTGSTTTTKGSVVVNADGTFSYTPTAIARHNAAFNSDTADSFTVTVADGYGGTVNVPVGVTISPAAVTFDWSYGSGSQYWSDPAKAALNTAATRLSSYIVVGSPVTITTTLIGQNNPQSNFLASSYSNFTSSNPGYYGTIVQTKILTGVDANAGNADSQLTWNFYYNWGLGNTVQGNQYDFQSVAMHEIMHSLGFLSGVSAPGTNNANWTTYDSFLSTANGTAVINPDYTYNAAYNANLTGGNGGLYFDGPNAVAVYGGLVPLNTPSTWASGSSVTHLNATPVKPVGTTAYLMDPSDGYGLGVRVITPVEIGIMKDLGYTIVAPSSASVFFVFGFGLLRRRRSDRVD